MKTETMLKKLQEVCLSHERITVSVTHHGKWSGANYYTITELGYKLNSHRWEFNKGKVAWRIKEAYTTLYLKTRMEVLQEIEYRIYKNFLERGRYTEELESVTLQLSARAYNLLLSEMTTIKIPYWRIVDWSPEEKVQVGNKVFIPLLLEQVKRGRKKNK